MPRLTRTQKFAELRESLANDKESSLQTKDLSNYEDRLNSITELLTPQTPVQETSVTPEVKPEEPVEVSLPEQSVIEEEDPKYTWTDFEETPIESLVENFRSDDYEEEHIEELKQESGIWHSIQETPVMPEEKKDEAPVVTMTEPAEEVSAASVTETETPVETMAYEAPVIDESLYTTPYTQIEKPVVETPVYEGPIIDESLYTVSYAQPEEASAEAPVYEAPLQEETAAEPEEEIHLGLYKPNPEIEALYIEAEEKAKEEEALAAAKQEAEAEKAAEETPAVEEEVFIEEPIEIEVPETVKEEKSELESMVDEFVDNHVLAHEEAINSYVSNTMDEVSRYNEANGDMTISQIASNMVHEVRHPGEEIKPEAPVQQKVVEEEKTAEELKKEDDEFSNTVSMEIAKIMDEIDTMELKQEPAAPVITEEPIRETVQPTPVKEEPVRPEPVKTEPVKEEPVVEEHPVLAKALEDEYAEEVVEIKNLTELEAEPIKDTVSNTIPFVVATSDDEEEIEDDDEESSNTILNIILIVLIIVLVAVLGLIVFYILKTKGII